MSIYGWVLVGGAVLSAVELGVIAWSLVVWVGQLRREVLRAKEDSSFIRRSNDDLRDSIALHQNKYNLAMESNSELKKQLERTQFACDCKILTLTSMQEEMSSLKDSLELYKSAMFATLMSKPTSSTSSPKKKVVK